MNQYPNIALIGRMGVGKTSIAQELVALHDYTRFSWAAPVKTIAKAAYGEIVKERPYEVVVDGNPAVRTGREILQRIGTDALRDNVDQDFWIKIGTRIIEAHKDEHLVNDDTRFPNEAATLNRLGWIIVSVELEEGERLRRLRNAYGEGMSADLLKHPSETEIKNIGFHYRVWNTAPAGDVAKAIMHTLSQAAA